MKRAGVALAFALATVGTIHRASAQSPSAAVSADAIVVTSGINITTLRDLVFGPVITGVATTVQPVDVNAGEWEVIGNANAFATITFTLPALLTNIQALPGSTMPISFNATSARWRRANNNPAGATPFNPAVGTVGRFGPPPNPTFYIWLGGTVNPAPTAKPGIYQGTVIVTLVYL